MQVALSAMDMLLAVGFNSPCAAWTAHTEPDALARLDPSRRSTPHHHPSTVACRRGRLGCNATRCSHGIFDRPDSSRSRHASSNGTRDLLDGSFVVLVEHTHFARMAKYTAVNYMRVPFQLIQSGVHPIQLGKETPHALPRWHAFTASRASHDMDMDSPVTASTRRNACPSA
ncbi:hypothetical protein BC831DRAFT_6009 [Entophlyctis helioformis]|nr:hypothetical protein BC831DRAFT_6009 [Entophlyctis helioformis]